MTGPQPWVEGRLRAAWLRKDWPVIFRTYRNILGISQARLGQLIDMPQPHISAVENGRRRIMDADLIQRIAEGLQVPEELGGVHRPEMSEWSPDPELREMIARAHTTGHADVRIADWIAHVLTEHRRAEDVVGGRELWPVVRSQLDTVTRLLPGTSGTVADRLLILAAEHAHWLSWVAHREGKSGPALAWLDLAHGWAVDAGSADMAAWVTRVRSFYMLQQSDPKRAYRIAKVACQEAIGASPTTASITAHQASLSSAAVGERDEARRLADEAYDLALRTPDEVDRPNWLYWLDPVRARLHKADAAYAVRDWQSAAEGFRTALPELVGYPRDLAFYAARMQDAAKRA
ncbi:helix-turn-helix domain-containing protein [Nonomuraea polychroma]|uniref:helix-turn-helix domain-containing protein n=1 Tax=Nonomuraea polychroma TaxID=46176 RepID=UPI003D8F5090